MKCGKYDLRKGRKVKVFSGGDKKQYLGIWEYCGAEIIGYTFKGGRAIPHFVPKFKQGRKRIRGYECWWIPLSVAREAEKELIQPQAKKEKG